ncbi:hypothetical protein WJX72_003455 [[Myrmecia] bisecta]|uniref:tRNA-dihydrouridine(47) synthase [NAD(P)(+)] n=1 Tax=[Myrmecia] bisecta TaxID=41462 RepID=A0AAW1PJH4_9CHLO
MHSPEARLFLLESLETARSGRDSYGERGGGPFEPVALSAEQLQRNEALIADLRGKLILAPLTRGGNVPFRRLCADFGADVTMSEMAFARNLIKNHPTERTRLKRAANEICYGVQIATNNIGEGVKAGELAAASGARWLDLNCGCPIYEASRRGLGAVLLRKPKKLARLVAGIASGIDIPFTVKIRTGENAGKVNAPEVVALLQDAGAAAVTIHGRTMEQRYKKSADWTLISDIAKASSVPLIGNGDILTHYEARHRLDGSHCLALMSGRGALIKPWIFQEFKEGRCLDPDARDRVAIYRQFVAHCKEHFGDDAKGRQKAWYFLPWHFSFLCRYRPFPEEQYGARALEHPLIATRWDVADEAIGQSADDLPLLERLLRCANEQAHLEIAAILWDSRTDQDAIVALEQLADSSLAAWEEDMRNTIDRDGRGREDLVAEG